MGWNPVKEAKNKAKQAVARIIKPGSRAAERSVQSAALAVECWTPDIPRGQRRN